MSVKEENVLCVVRSRATAVLVVWFLDQEDLDFRAMIDKCWGHYEGTPDDRYVDVEKLGVLLNDVLEERTRIDLVNLDSQYGIETEDGSDLLAELLGITVEETSPVSIARAIVEALMPGTPTEF
jgi:hypothetical protein